MGFKSGISANINNINFSEGDKEFLDEKIKVGRVTDIILNTNYPNIQNLGGDSAIGTILFKPQNFNTPGVTFAKPFFPNISSYPLINELVLIFKLPGNNINKAGANETFYYISSINLWNSPHHNAFPNLYSTLQNGNSQQSNSANPKVNSKEIPQVPLNSPINKSQQTFLEKDNIHPLLPFPGDNIYQGRFGNSVRLGSTAPNPSNIEANLNEWSKVGFSGDPITIIRNGQPQKTTKQGYKHITEHINDDLTSIHLTSTQQIPIKPSSENYRSFTTPPISSNLYDKPQIILNSNRIIANAKKDSILLSAQKSISLSTNESVNINTKNMVVDAGSIKLGSKNAVESVVKGDTLYFQLNSVLKALIQMTSILKTSQLWPNGVPVADVAKNQIYDNVQTQLQLVQEDLETMLSKNVKTI